MISQFVMVRDVTVVCVCVCVGGGGGGGGGKGGGLGAVVKLLKPKPNCK